VFHKSIYRLNISDELLKQLLTEVETTPGIKEEFINLLKEEMAYREQQLLSVEL
jgi:hypothetical protein